MHTYAETIIYIDAREFRKHNKKIVWLMVFMLFLIAYHPHSPSHRSLFSLCIWYIFALARNSILNTWTHEHMNSHKYVVTKASNMLFLWLFLILTNITLTSVQFAQVSSTSTSCSIENNINIYVCFQLSVKLEFL